MLKELQATNALTPEHLVVSIAAGVTIANMEVNGAQCAMLCGVHYVSFDGEGRGYGVSRWGGEELE